MPQNQELQCLKAEDGCLYSRREKGICLSSTLWSIGPPDDWMMPTSTDEAASSLRSIRIQMIISSRNIFTDTLRNNV